MGRATDRTTLHFRILNRSKGPAVRAPRAQCDRGLYPRAVREILESFGTCEMYQATVTALDVRGRQGERRDVWRRQPVRRPGAWS